MRFTGVIPVRRADYLTMLFLAWGLLPALFVALLGVIALLARSNEAWRDESGRRQSEAERRRAAEAEVELLDRGSRQLRAALAEVLDANARARDDDLRAFFHGLPAATRARITWDADGTGDPARTVPVPRGCVGCHRDDGPAPRLGAPAVPAPEEPG